MGSRNWIEIMHRIRCNTVCIALRNLLHLEGSSRLPDLTKGSPVVSSEATWTRIFTVS